MPDPDPLASLLAKAAESLGIQNPIQAARLFRDWEEIVGATVAGKCRPVALKGGVLKVRTASAAWASEFRYLAPSVIARINGELGAEVVTEILPAVDPSAVPPDGTGAKNRRSRRR
ncbi:MAG: DUF721 domain-containing protein [Actinomycetota bacterium]